MPSKKTQIASSGRTHPIREILTGRFLAQREWVANWPFVLYLSLLALIMIASSHSAERKVHRISNLTEEVKEKSSRYIELHARVMNTSMESKVVQRAAQLGLEKPQTPPQLLVDPQSKSPSHE